MGPKTLRSAIARSLLAIALLVVPSAALAQGSATVTVPVDYPTIQSAIDAVLNGTLADRTTIDVLPGTYFENIRVFAKVGLTAITAFTVRGVGGPTVTIVDANHNGLPLLISGDFNNSNTSGIVFQGLTFRNGAQSGLLISAAVPLLKDCVFELNTGQQGGGVYMQLANPRFVDCAIRNNSASRAGGGVHMINSSATFTRCDIEGNTSGTGDGRFSNGAGGGVFVHQSAVTFRGGRISGNSSTYGGGGVQHSGDWSVRSILRLEDVEIADNTVRRHPVHPTPTIGGGVNTEENATTSILRSRILRNHAENGGGLGVSLGRYDIVDSTIRENQATTGAGGGIAAAKSVFATPAKPASVVTLTRSIVRDNTAPMAGGIASLGDVPSQQGATLRLTESVVSGNQSQSHGGGILASATFLTLVNSLVINNTVSGAGFAHGGGIFLTTYSWAAIETTTIAHNTASGLGGGLFVNSDGNAIEMSGSQVYGNTALATGAGLFIGGGTTGTVHGNILADNAGVQSNAQVVEDGGACSSVTYPNNLITALASDGCPSLPSRMPGTDSSSTPRFVKFLAAPRLGTAMSLAWSAARATSVTIAGVGTVAQSTGLADVTPGTSTTYTLTATASDANGGAYGPVSVRAVVRPPALGTRTVDGDLDGDGQPELVVYRPSAGDWFRWNLKQAAGQLSCGIFCGEPTGNPRPAMGDFDGDGRADAVWFTPSTGNWHVVHATNLGAFDVLWGNAADRLVPADYDGDGRTDIAVFRPSDGVWYLRLSSTGATPSYAWGNAADIPVPADYDGDGRADLGVYRPSDGMWWVFSPATGAVTGYYWGASGDRPVPGDYDGDGRTDVAVFRPSDGGWYVWYSDTGTTAAYAWGNSTDIPAPGDYNGDGLADLAVFRAGTWYVWYSGTSTTASYAWGGATDVPILRR